jgi:hypothetical protein
MVITPPPLPPAVPSELPVTSPGMPVDVPLDTPDMPGMDQPTVGSDDDMPATGAYGESGVRSFLCLHVRCHVCLVCNSCIVC